MAIRGGETSIKIRYPLTIIHPSGRRPSIAVFALGTTALRHPSEEMLETRTLAPEKAKELRSAERLHVSAKKSFEAPANIWAAPRTQPVTLGSRPVVAESGEHRSTYFQPSRARSEVMCAT